MNPATWKTIKETFSTALALPLPEREGFLASSSEEIRREVEKLLSTYKEAQTFIGTPLIVEKGLRPNPLEENLSGKKIDDYFVLEKIGREVEKLLSTYKEAQTFIGTPLIVEKGLRPNPLEENLSGKKIDDYFVLEKIGEGGMGIVFLAEHCGQGFSKRVALKLIKRGMDTNAVLGRFLLERQILADLEHPNIARLYGGGSTTDGLPYFVMEHVEGESIRDFCDHQRFDIDDRLRLFTKVCGAISYAHQQLIVHRDIKPSNIIVTASGEPKLLDFGIAKLLLPSDRNAERTATQFHVMTPEYASPEQLSGKATTTATDVYSLGVVLYELLTGTRPFDFKGKSLIEISDQLRTQRPARPSDCHSVTERAAEVISTAPVPKTSDTSSGANSRQTLTSMRNLKGDLDNIILQAIRREPERRYQSVVEFSDDIQRYLTGLPVKATGDTVGYRTHKFINRHRTVVTATVCFMLLLMLSTAITGWQYFVARAQRAKAEHRLTELRGVARSMLTETNAALKKLPQGLEIRKSIVEKSVAVLDNLASEESNDPNFLNELADAYLELSRIRHWQLHQSRLALSDVQKAVELRRRAIALAPTPGNHKKLSDSLSNMAEVYTSLSDREGLLRVWQDLRENDLRILELEPDNPQGYFSASTHGEDLANALGELGRTDESDAQLKVSFDLIEKAISLQQAAPVSIDGQLAMVWYLMQKANLLHRSQRSDEALAVYQSAADLAEKTYRADNTKVFAFNHASRTHRYMADIHAEKGDWQKYLECSEFSVNWIKQNYDNRNLWFGGVPPNTAYYQMRVGIGLNKVGQRAAGIAAFEEGMKQYRDGLPTRVDDGEGLYYAFDILEPATEFYLDTNQDNKAIGIWEQYIRLAEPFVAKNPDDPTSLGLVAHALDRKGDVLAKYQKEPKTFAATDPAQLGAALKSYEESRQRQQKMVQLDPANQAHRDSEKVLEEKISRLNARLNR